MTEILLAAVFIIGAIFILALFRTSSERADARRRNRK